MQREMKLEMLEDFYSTRWIKPERENGRFVLVDEEAKVDFILPRMFYLFQDGEPLDPIRLLRLSEDLQKIIFDERFMPYELDFLCGRCITDEDTEATGRVKFEPLDPMLASREMCESILFRATWDLHVGITDQGWTYHLKELYGSNFVPLKRRIFDPYEAEGAWYFLLRCGEGETVMGDFSGFITTMLTMQYIRLLRPVIEYADRALRRFAKEKSVFREKIMGIIGRLNLVEPDQPGWSMSETDDRVELRHNDGLGRIEVNSFRFDNVGYRSCLCKFGVSKGINEEN